MITPKQIFLSTAIAAILIPALHANPILRRAKITFDGHGSGKCSIEVNVDGSAEVEISGDTGWLKTLSGRTAVWRRFHCNQPLPRDVGDFRFAAIEGHGAARLVRDPRRNGGRAVVRIDDPKSGPEDYAFVLHWTSSRGNGWPPPPQPGYPGGPGGFPMARAIRSCQEQVTSRLNGDGYRHVSFERTIPDDRPGRNNTLIGTASGKQGFVASRFSFSCYVEIPSGLVRSVDVRRR
jgi:hypothetical protein